MFITEVIVCSGVELDSIILRGVSNVLQTLFTNTKGGRILETHFNIQYTSDYYLKQLAWNKLNTISCKL